ncbi:MAG: sterol desaturase family protein [Opitutaceae bacterium]
MPLYLKFYFWLLLISAVMFTLERLFPWRRSQEILRAGFVQDLFWMVFNMQYVSWMLAIATVQFVAWFNSAFTHFGFPPPESLSLISRWPSWSQFIVFFLIKDFLEWNIHRVLHIVPWLWRLHELHHSSEQLDWAASFRSHWAEIIIYKAVIYMPLVVLGVPDQIIFSILVASVVVQELSHANLNWDWGPLRYLINSPRFHAWHHDVQFHQRNGQNFGVNLVVWDWLFGTVYWPKTGEAPERFGLTAESNYPEGIWRRLWAPFLPRAKSRQEEKTE